MKKRILTLLLICLLGTNTSYADISNSTVSAFMYDGSGNSISSTGGSLNTSVTNTVPVSQSGTWSVGITGTTTISGTITANQGGAPWSQNITEVGGSSLSLGQTTMSASIPVAISSDQSAIPVTQSGTWNVGLNAGSNNIGSITNITGTISLPTNASTSADQTNGSQKTQVVDGSGNVVGPVQTISGTNYIPTVLAASAIPGSASVARSIQIAGSDGTNAQTISTNTSGQININNIGGTVSLPIGAATSVNQTSVIGTVSPGTAGTNSNLVGGVYNTGILSMTTGQQASVQLDPGGAIRTTGSSSSNQSATLSANGNLVATGNLQQYSGMTLVLTGTWSANVQVVGSQDGTNYFPVAVINLGTPGTGSLLTITSNGIYYAPVTYTFLEVVVSSYVSGTVVSVANFHAISPSVPQPSTVTVTQSTASNLNAQVVGNVASAAADSGNPVKMGGLYTTSVPTLTTGQRGNILIDVNGNTQTVGNTASATTDSGNPIKVGGVYTTSVPTLTTGQRGNILIDVNGNTQIVGNIASGVADSGNPVKIGTKFNSTLPAIATGERADAQSNQFGELAVITRGQYKHVAGAATTTIKSGSGRLHALCYNNATTGIVLTAYDNTAGSGTEIAVLTTNGNSTPNCMIYDVEFTTGLTILGTGAGAQDYTVSFY